MSILNFKNSWLVGFEPEISEVGISKITKHIKDSLGAPLLVCVVPRVGFEPTTLSLEVSCSIQLSYRGAFVGAGGGSRTLVLSLENSYTSRCTTPA